MLKVREGYKMTELGEIPVEWDVQSIDDVFNIIGGVPLPRSKTGNGNTYYLHYGDIHKLSRSLINTEFDKSWLPLIDETSNVLRRDAYLEDGDVVFADASEDYLDIGKNVVVRISTPHEFVAGLHTIVAREKADKLILGYKQFCFKTEEVRKQLATLATGSTVLGISKSNISKVKFLQPPLEEQQKIAEILTTVDEQIENTEQRIEKTKELKRGLMQQLLTKGIGHTEFMQTELGRVPALWDLKKIGEVTDIKSGLTPLRSESKYFENGTIPWVKTTDLNNDDIVETSENITEKALEETSLTIHNENTVLVAMYGGYNQIGRTGLLKIKATTNQAISSLVLTSNDLDPKYLQIWLNAKVNLWKKYAASSRKDPNITKADVQDFKILIPSLSEQQKIASILSSVDKQIESYEQEKQKYLELKKGLMQQLLTGQLRVTV
ncbi:restriction endonuclease subunit S [Brevibacillus porteri]|uniref:Type I restriction modification DNA specificity domain-containing protein n=1 Tax=Brevibacillus porteri TaxID=2126350 RepID=A0ABX5FU46_9BACL|nr:restriction endonuclease subunit S [Brevibacillus porteri]MED1797381.1 restriction endonuclease subunit S [Brevibacillus porteri]MED2129451.1 restriction endonuclease subunit S [Brevibacillus porteri]MED2747626.1 restriction endonuclease subunit S [Brevibacillus porteri]MED2815641.1 restriction endonuclease subunit S [Brevibacillus porteri]MED2896754.1 restriction endonuclease subunit S [Brevibacillus porteri]